MAIEKKLPLIIDEKKGRKFAQRCCIEIIGLVGILRFIYLNKMLTKTEVIEIIEHLNKSDFRISEKLMKSIVK